MSHELCLSFPRDSDMGEWPGHLCQLEDDLLAIEDTGWRGKEGGALLRLSVPA